MQWQSAHVPLYTAQLAGEEAHLSGELTQFKFGRLFGKLLFSLGIHTDNSNINLRFCQRLFMPIKSQIIKANSPLALAKIL